MSRSVSRMFLLAFVLLSLPALQGCNKVWATWKDKTISVTTASEAIELVTKEDSAEIKIGHRKIVLRENSVMDGRSQSVSQYKRVVVTEEGDGLILTLDGKRTI